MSKSYLVKLTPLDYYYFGGEESFDLGAKGLRNYLVRSNLLPQQTGLLGLIRHTLFGQYDIGNSFNAPEGFNLGVIKNLSPVFIVNEKNEFIIPSPLNVNKKGLPVDVSFESTTNSFVNGIWKSSVPLTHHYSAKDGLGNYWINTTTESAVAEDCLFTKSMHIGIDKRKRTANNDDLNAFYKQEFITLSKGNSFGFTLELDDSVDVGKIPSTMPFGGEKRTFAIKIEVGDSWDTIKNNFSRIAIKSIGSNTGVVLLSDTYVKDSSQLFSLVNYGIVDEKPFRNIITPAATENFATLTKSKTEVKGLQKSNKLDLLLKRGSVLYAEAEQKAAIETMLNISNYQTIGYNQFISNF